MSRKINIVPESVFNKLKGNVISKVRLEAIMKDIINDSISYRMCYGALPSNLSVRTLVAVVQFLWNENVDLNERLRALMPEQPMEKTIKKEGSHKKTIKKKSIHKGKFQCVKCGEWYPHSKVEVWDENPSVIRYICHRCQEEEEI